MLKRLLSLLTLLIVVSGTANSQTFPVVSTTQIIPPYSVYLTDYASTSSDKLIANLMLQDQNQSGIQVKLKITITGDNGVKLETKPEFMPPPITLYAGTPEIISGIALQDYLEPANLNLTGLNFSQFMQTKKLPEGIYQFTVEAVEYRRNKAVSNPGTAVGWLILNDPPIWNLPQHNSTITATNPQNIFFSWFPMHSGSPNSAFTTEYEFSLYDLIPQTANPDEYVNIAVPIHQSTTMSNSLVYGPSEIPLEPGRKYAARLKAYDTEGRDMFKNNGYSTVLVFTYGQQCITPVGISHDNLTPHTADINWTSIPGNTEFTLYYREKDESNTNPWYEGTTSNTNATITQLKPEYTYQYVLKAWCGTLESEPSAIYEFTTTEKVSDTLNCDGNTDIPVIDGSPPLEELLIGDIINVGGFEGIITQARGGSGVFSGKCIMRVSNFNILLKSHFDDIHINQSYQVTDGYVIADRGPGIMINLDDIEEELDSLANIEIDSTIIDDPEGYLEDLEIIYELDPVIVNDSIAEDLEEIQDDLEELLGSGELTDEEIETIEDLLEQIENLLNGGNQSDDHPSFVMFKAHPNQLYGFDEPDSVASLREYYQPPNIINGNEQLIRWKSVKANSPDVVYARLDSIHPMLKFYNETGTEIIPQNGPADTVKVINLQGSIAGTTEHITAQIEVNDSTTIDAGILNVVSYSEIPKELMFVPVNGNSLPSGMNLTQLADSLNKTYGQAVVHWSVSPMHPNIDFDYEFADQTEGFNAWPETGMQYTPDMQALINEFMQTGNFDPDKYYIFLLDDAESPIQLGIMPFFQNFAFVFADKLGQAQNFAKTCAHELGHGSFGLEHSFKRHENIDEFGTPNLMTYHPTATYLYKYQWDLIHNPVCWLDGDCGTGEAAVMSDNIEALLKLTTTEGTVYSYDIPNIENQYCFYAPSGIPFWIRNAQTIWFLEDGSVGGFKVNNITYIGLTDDLNVLFYLYYNLAHYNELKNDPDKLIFDNFVSLQDLNDNKIYLNPEIAEQGDNVLIYKDYSDLGFECRKIEHWELNDPVYPVKLRGKVKSVNVPGTQVTTQTFGQSCENVDANLYYGIEDGIGGDIFVLFNQQCADDEEFYELYDYCIRLNEEENSISDKPFHLSTEFVSQLQQENINTFDQFYNTYYVGFAAGILVISKDDLWIELEEGYNSNTAYEYTPGDLRIRYICLQENGVLATYIKNLEEAGNAEGLTSQSFVDKYGAASSLVAFILFFEAEADLVEIEAIVNTVKVTKRFFKTRKTNKFSLEDAATRKLTREIKLANLIRKKGLHIELDLTDEMVMKLSKNDNTFNLINNNAAINKLKNIDINDRFEFIDNICDNNNIYRSFNSEPVDILDAWHILKTNRRIYLKTSNEAIVALKNIRKNPKINELSIDDDMLGNIWGTMDVSYANILDDLNIAINSLPTQKTTDFFKVVSDGQRGLVNKNNVWDRRHSWLTLKKIKENETFFNNSDVSEIKFEVELEEIDGISHAVPDIVIFKNGGAKKILGEVKAGDNIVTSNFNSQSLNYFNQIDDIRDLRFFHRSDVQVNKQDIIDAWRNGGVLDNNNVFNLFKNYDENVIYSNYDFEMDGIEGFLNENDNWFNLLFNSIF
jgi:hypothetical protein